jgi:hypothetical protein
MSTSLRDGVQKLETTTKVTLTVLSLASGVYTYLGVRELLGGNGVETHAAAAIYSVAVTVGIYAFWTYMMRLGPHMRDSAGRALLFGCMAIGSLMIIAMSAWLNASALAGSAALQQHLAATAEAYSRDLDKAHRHALAAQGLVPDIQMASARFARLAESERSGSLTGSAGSGTIVQLLAQMSTQLGGLSREVTLSAERAGALFEQGSKHIIAMRELVAANGPISTRSEAFGVQVQALTGVIASLQQTTVAPAVKRAAEGMTTSFIAPTAGGKTSELAERQTAMVGRVETAVAAQSTALVAAADRILSAPPVEPAKFQAISQAEAVVRYARDFIPSWAGAIAIDLMPGVLVLMLCVAHAAIRRNNAELTEPRAMSSTDLIAAVKLVRELERAKSPDAFAEVAAAVAPPPLTAEEHERVRELADNVHQLVPARS